MKIRTLKKKNPSKLQRIWIKHLVEWIKLETEYNSIRKYYIKSCEEKLWKQISINTIVLQRSVMKQKMNSGKEFMKIQKQIIGLII